MTKDIDNEICLLYNHSKIAGIELLFTQYYKSLVLWADVFLKHVPESEDLVHDFIVKLWERRLFIHLSPVTLRSYLYNAIKNAAINKIKKKDPLRKYTLCDVQLPYIQDDIFEEMLISRIEEEIVKLPRRSREVVELVYIKGKSYKQTAEALGVSVATVKTLLVHSLKKLRITMACYKQEIVMLLTMFNMVE